jgi:hypothetical protein
MAKKKTEQDDNIIGVLVMDSGTVRVHPTKKLIEMDVRDQWIAMRAVQRAVDRIVYRLSDEAAEANRRALDDQAD